MIKLTRTIGLIVISLVSLLIMTQCGHEEPVLAPNVESLIGTWRLVGPDSTYGTTLKFALDTANPPLDITPFNASGKASVNSYTLRLYATLDGTLSADHLGYTDMAGSQESMKFEQTYFKNLNAVARFELPKPNRLRIYHGGELPHVMEYEKQN